MGSEWTVEASRARPDRHAPLHLPDSPTQRRTFEIPLDLCVHLLRRQPLRSEYPLHRVPYGAGRLLKAVPADHARFGIVIGIVRDSKRTAPRCASPWR